MQPIEEDLLHLLRSTNSRDTDRAFRILYEEQYPIVARYISSRSGQTQAADDLFQEGLIVLYKMARQGRLDHVKSIPQYLFTVCKHFWYRQQQQKGQTVAIEDQVTEIVENPTVLSHLFATERGQLIDKLLQQLGTDCKTLLIHFYYDRLSMKEILQKMHYNSEAALKNKKSKCMKKLRDLCEAIPQLRNLLN
ncbi:MAG: sigma-70 family RNA polymerase sigma factor [Bacteroidota bacterium]